MSLHQMWKNFVIRLVELLPVIIWKIFLIILVLVLSAVIIKVGKYLIVKLFEKQKKFKFSVDGKKLDTVSTILCSLLKYGVYFIAGVTILTSVLQIFDIKTVLTAAGIGGIALGLGAQSIIRDVINGSFILLENQFVVGDIVTINGLTGTVEEMELRVTKIRNFNGEVYIIPNGDIKTVTNHTKRDRIAIVDVKISYRVGLSKTIELIEKACKLLEQESKVLAEHPKVLGIVEFADTYYVVRTIAKTIGSNHWDTERELRSKIMECFEEEGIKLGIG